MVETTMNEQRKRGYEYSPAAPWIRETLEMLPPDTSSDGRAIALAVLTGAAIVADVLSRNEDTVADELMNVARTIYDASRGDS